MNKKMIYILSSFIFAVIILSAAENDRIKIFGDSFANGTLKNYIDGRIPGNVSFAPSKNNSSGKMLVCPKGFKGSLSFKKVRVKPGVKYKLDFMAKIDGKDVIEKNSRIGLIQVSSSNILYHWRIVFFDSTGKRIPRAIQSNHLSLVSNEWKKYTSVFYTPPNAVYLKLGFSNSNPENGMMLENLDLGLCPDEGAINCNPEFSYGAYNYAGWRFIISGGLLFKTDKGKYVLDSAYGSTSRRFPLISDGTYRLYARGIKSKGYSVVNIFFVDAKGKNLKQIHMRAAPEGKYIDFVPPVKTAFAYFRVYKHILEAVRLTRIGDKSLLKKTDGTKSKKK